MHAVADAMLTHAKPTDGMGIVFVALWTLVGFGILSRMLPRYSDEEQKWMRIGFAMAALFSVLHPLVVLYVLGGGDMSWYHRAGSQLVDLWMRDPVHWTGQILRLTFRQSAHFPFWVHGSAGGSATGAMFGVSTWLMLFNAKSLYGACTMLAMLNFFSRLLAYQVFRRMVPEEYRRYVLWGVLLLPSAVFWTSGLEKEAVAMVGMGVAVYGAYQLATGGGFVRGILCIAAGGLPMYLVKPYVLFPLFIAAPVWYLTYKIKKESSGAGVLLTPMRLVIFGVLVAGGLAALAIAVPSLSVDSLDQQLMHFQTTGTHVSGTTNYTIVSAQAASRGGITQFLFAPIGFLFAMTRPWPFEVRSIQMLVATVESTFLVGTLLLSMRRMGVLGWFKRIIGTPWLAFCLAYVVIFGAAVGLATTNVGSLSRYRVPMLGFYGALVAMSYAWAYRGASAPAGERDTIAEPSLLPAHDGRPAWTRGTRRRAPLQVRNRRTRRAHHTRLEPRRIR